MIDTATAPVVSPPPAISSFSAYVTHPKARKVNSALLTGLALSGDGKIGISKHANNSLATT